MTKTEFTAFLAKRNGFSLPYSEKILNAVLDTIEDALFRDGRVVLQGFGIFDCRAKKARQGRNPATGEPLDIPAMRIVRFRAAKRLKEFLD